jgi:mannose-1-phosphate guanylyltransferase
MLRLFEEKDGEAVILGTRVPNDAANNFGCIVSDSHTKRVLHYVEKPESYISNLINCGVYLFATEAIFPSIKSAIKRRADRPRLVSYPSSDALDSAYLPRATPDDDDDGEISEVIRLEQDILSDLADSRQFFVLETKDFWRQIKTAGSAVPANALYLMKAFQQQSEELAKPSATILPPVFIHPTAQVDPTAKLGPNVSIGPRAVIGAGARIKEAIVLEDAEIKHDACVLYAIIGWSSRVGAWARVEGYSRILIDGNFVADTIRPDRSRFHVRYLFASVLVSSRLESVHNPWDLWSPATFFDQRELSHLNRTDVPESSGYTTPLSQVSPEHREIRK